jgi:hypothetical protein
MLSVNLQSYTKPCEATTGGISEIWIFDPADFNFTQGAAVSGNLPGYSAVALIGASTGKMYPLSFQNDEAEYKFKQTVNGASVKYEHDVMAQLPNLSNDLTNYLRSLDVAGTCTGFGVIIRLNTGKIFVAGERFVNSSAITKFIIKMDGTEGGSGKKLEDFNGANVAFKANYSRGLYEFTGGVTAITDLE